MTTTDPARTNGTSDQSAAPDAPDAPHAGAHHHAHHGLATSVVDRILANPLVGLSPWIVYSVVEGPRRLELSVALAFGLAVAILAVNWIRGGTPKMLEYSDAVFFGAMAIVVHFSSPATHRWLELWGGEVANTALVVIALGSILLRMPFTLQYAREDTPKEYWHEPGFLRANYLISWIWVAAFAIEAASGFYSDAVLHDPNNIWFSWILETLPLIVAAQFTIWYPNRLRAVAAGRAEAAPTVRDFLAQVTPWITIVGIIVLSVGGSPDWVGIALIIVGITLTKTLTAAKTPATSPA